MIAVEKIGLVRGNFTLTPVSFAVPQGSYAVLMGPSGAGKTLLLETIAGFYPADEGKISVAGKDVTALPPDKRGVGFVYQDYSLFPHLSVEENVAYGLKMARIPSRERRETVQKLLAQFNLSPHAGRYPGTLSGGEKQRVAIARALATRPAVLLLDEPFAALDPHTRLSCMKEVKAIQKTHSLTILQVSHAREEAYQLADQVIIMERGKILQIGQPADVFSRPAHRTVAALAGYENVLEGTISGGNAGKTHLTVDGKILIATGDSGTGDRCLVCIRASDITLHQTGHERDDSANYIEGQISSTTPSDNGVLLHIEGPISLNVAISRQDHPVSGYRPGDRITVRIAEEDLHLIKVSLSGEDPQS